MMKAQLFIPSLRGDRRPARQPSLPRVRSAIDSLAIQPQRNRIASSHALLATMLVFMTFFVFSFVAHAEPKEAVVDLAEDFIPVTEDFDGARMTVFGALRYARSNIVVVFEGPPAKALVREKVRQAGIWINGDPQTLAPVPSFYAVLSSSPLDKMMSAATKEKLALGLDALTLDGAAGRGLIENRAAKGLYVELPHAVKIRDRKLFRADIYLPPNVPVGTYKAMIYEINGGNVAASRETSFKIEPIGTASMIRRLAFQYPLSYAVLAIVLVLLIGGTGAHIFRKAS